MRNTGVIASLGIALSMILSAQAHSQSTSKAAKSRIHPVAAYKLKEPIQIKSLNGLVIDAICTLPNKPSINVARITIENLNLKRIKHRMELFASDSTLSQSTGAVLDKIPHKKIGTTYDTRFDFNTKKYVKDDGIMLVEISLEDPDISFYPSTLAITAGDKLSNGYFCVKQPIDGASGARTLSFYIKKPSAGTTKVLSYGIALVVTDSDSTTLKYKLPVIIDPGVQNEG